MPELLPGPAPRSLPGRPGPLTGGRRAAGRAESGRGRREGRGGRSQVPGGRSRALTAARDGREEEEAAAGRFPIPPRSSLPPARLPMGGGERLYGEGPGPRGQRRPPAPDSLWLSPATPARGVHNNNTPGTTRQRPRGTGARGPPQPGPLSCGRGRLSSPQLQGRMEPGPSGPPGSDPSPPAPAAPSPRPNIRSEFELRFTFSSALSAILRLSAQAQ